MTRYALMLAMLVSVVSASAGHDHKPTTEATTDAAEEVVAEPTTEEGEKASS